MVRVWFNHWFSTSYGLIELMKDCGQEISVIATNKEINSVIQNVCDEWYPEPRSDGEAYIQDCLDFCRDHQIDVFVPRRKMVEISKNRERFQEIGVSLMVDDYSRIAVLNDKAQTYRLLSDIPGIHIPDYEVVNTVQDFEQAYSRLKAKYDRLCVKFVNDEGAMSFRKIADDISPCKRLRIYQGAEVSYADYVNALKCAGNMDDLMIMPYLAGTEISVDCLKTPKGIIAIPRYKSLSRHEEIRFDRELLNTTKAIVERVGLEQPCNVQYRVRNGVPYLLEINTRMSGGLQMSCLGTGVNIPGIALCQLLGKTSDWTLEERSCIVSYIETPKMIRYL